MSVLQENFCTNCNYDLRIGHGLEEEGDECECNCEYPTVHNNKVKDIERILGLIELGYHCEVCKCKMTPRPHVAVQNSMENTESSSGMSKTSKILIGLAGASVVAGLIATGIYYPMKVLKRKRSGSKRKTKKNRRSKRKN